MSIVKNNLRLILVLCIILVISIISTISVIASFKDTKDHWAKEYIDDLYKEGVLVGYEDGTFQPDREISIEEFATFLDRYFFEGFDRTGTTKENWSDKHIEFLEKEGILFNYGSKEDTLTRIIALRTIISSIEDSEDYLVDDNPPFRFPDLADINPNDYKYINLGILENVIHGYNEDNTFRPDRIVTRAEAAKMLFLLKHHKKFEIKTPEIEKVNDLEVVSVTGGRYESGETVTIPVVVRNNGDRDHDTNISLSNSLFEQIKPVTLKVGETKLIEFSVNIPEDIVNSYPLIANINKNKEIEEKNYANNIKVSNIEIIKDTPIPDLNCPSQTTWREYETIRSGDQVITYAFDYKATLQTKMTIIDDRELTSDPVKIRLKSGYGFKTNVESQIKTAQVSGAWKRQHTRVVKVPSEAKVVTSWKVTKVNKIGDTTILKREHFSTGNAGGTSYFITPVNPHSEIGASLIYTDLDLKGNKENPHNHPFKVYVKAGLDSYNDGQNGVQSSIELCNTLEGNIEIFGDMHQDWGVN